MILVGPFGAMMIWVVFLIVLFVTNTRKKVRSLEKESEILPTESEIVIFTEYGTWRDAGFYPDRELTMYEFRRAVRVHEEVLRKKLGPTYRYKGPVRLKVRPEN